jgi:hypothetical protein
MIQKELQYDSRRRLAFPEMCHKISRAIRRQS